MLQRRTQEESRSVGGEEARTRRSDDDPARTHGHSLAGVCRTGGGVVPSVVVAGQWNRLRSRRFESARQRQQQQDELHQQTRTRHTRTDGRTRQPLLADDQPPPPTDAPPVPLARWRLSPPLPGCWSSGSLLLEPAASRLDAAPTAGGARRAHILLRGCIQRGQPSARLLALSLSLSSGFETCVRCCLRSRLSSLTRVDALLLPWCCSTFSSCSTTWSRRTW